MVDHINNKSFRASVVVCEQPRLGSMPVSIRLVCKEDIRPVFSLLAPAVLACKVRSEIQVATTRSSLMLCVWSTWNISFRLKPWLTVSVGIDGLG